MHRGILKTLLEHAPAEVRFGRFSEQHAQRGTVQMAGGGEMERGGALPSHGPGLRALGSHLPLGMPAFLCLKEECCCAGVFMS